MNTSTLNSNKLNNYILGFIGMVIFVYLLAVLQDIFVPVLIAVFLTFLFHPLLKLLNEKLKIPKAVSLVVIFLFSLVIFYLVGLLIALSIQSFTGKVPEYSQKISLLVVSILEPFNITAGEIANYLKINSESADGGQLIKEIFNTGIIQNTLSSFSLMLGDIFLISLFWIFMIMGKEKFEERLKIAFQEKYSLIEESIKRIDNQMQSYIIIKSISSLITATLFTVILLIFGIDFAFFWGFLTFILNFIPNFGSIIATVFPVLISIIQYGFGITTLGVLVLLVLVQNVIGNILEPKYLGSKMDLSPVFVLFSLIFWGMIWGVVGMFLAVPIASIIKIICENVDSLKPVAILIGNNFKKSS